MTFPFRLLKWLFEFPQKAFQKLHHFLVDESEESLLCETLVDTFTAPSSLLEHADALRKHLTRMLIGLLICVAIVFIFTPKLVEFLAQPIGGISALKGIDVMESIGEFKRVALSGGFALASPNIIFELWLFAAPGPKV
jgi:Sec-independent protein secretion pathway component TatC